ncbi:MAG: cell division protein ZapA [Pseudomonadota bacterium]|jgi:cell division protein ZapA|nr:cell division protein ZapA [Pseudomonadota bacterium]|tara:strand:+ start:505 stop:792 length:288 start_codon:yes stop_codon:yes gene_type:complete
MEQEQITISVLDQEYKIKCQTSEIDLLQRSAAYLDIKMSEIKKNAPSMTKDKIAVMSALNIVSAYLKQEEELNGYSDVSDEINNLQKSLKELGIE